MHICIMTGARPNFMKVAPIMRAIDNARNHGRNITYQLVYAGTADDPTLEESLFSDLDIHKPDVFLGVSCENLNELTGQVMSTFERYLQEHKTDAVIVVDDLASTMAAAIVTKKQNITLAHLVAGTRSFDITMPKEINRLVIDGLSDLLFTAGMGSQSTATREGSQEKVYMVGNILMDTLRYNHNRFLPPTLPQPCDEQYIVFTLNRKALIADEENLNRMLDAIVETAGGRTVIAPLRGKAKEIVERHGGIQVVEPLSYLEFGWLTAHAKGIITDSGNVAEEATFNNVPCITLNSYTEHQETVKLGTNVLVGEDAGKLREAMQQLNQGEWKQAQLPDRWDGRTAERIVKILME